MARLVTGAGVFAATGGVLAWLTVRSQLVAERITIPTAARWLPGRKVKGPVSAYAEADAVERAALRATGGRTYGEIEEEDSAAQVAMDASLLRSSLFTTVLAFGVAAGQVALGGVLIAIGTALAKIARPGPGNN